MVQYKLPMGLRYAAHRRRGGRESKKLLGILNLPWQGFGMFFTKIEAYAGMVEQMVIDFAIEEALQD